MRILGLWIWIGLLAFGGVGAKADWLAFDEANDPVYLQTGWANGDNGGFGFGDWDLELLGVSGTAGFFIGDSSLNGDGMSGDINSTGGGAFGLFAEGGKLAMATRNLPGEMQVEEKFFIDMDTGYINNSEQNGGLGNGKVGVQLRNSEGGTRFEFTLSNGDPYYKINGLQTPRPFTDDGLHLEFVLTGTDTYWLSVSGLSQPLTGTLAGAGPIDQVVLFNFSSGSGTSRHAFFNNPTVVPEPGVMALVGLGVVWMVAIRLPSRRSGRLTRLTIRPWRG